MTSPDREGITDIERAAFERFSADVRAAYGPRLKGLVVFGSRARGDARRGSDLDVAVIFDDFADRYREKMALSDIAYEAVLATQVYVQPWPVTIGEWRAPRTERQSSPRLRHAARRRPP